MSRIVVGIGGRGIEGTDEMSGCKGEYADHDRGKHYRAAVW
jgi:hypothetical protein